MRYEYDIVLPHNDMNLNHKALHMHGEKLYRVPTPNTPFL